MDICKDVLGEIIEIGCIVTCFIEKDGKLVDDDGEVNQYEGEILELLPNNKVKVNIYDDIYDDDSRILILDGSETIVI